MEYPRGVDPGALEDITLPAAVGPPRRLGDLWARQPVVLVFLRHFG